MASLRSRVRNKFIYIRREIKNMGIVYAIVLVLLCFTALPLLLMINNAFKPIDELFLYPPRFFVQNPTIHNFRQLLLSMSTSAVPFSRFFFNSLFISISVVIGSVLLATMGAFSAGKYKPPGSKQFFVVVVAALSFAHEVSAIPSYMVINGLGLVNTYWALIVPKIALPMYFFLARQFVGQMPDDYLESARLDGASEWQLFWKIVMPYLKPAWSTLVVFSFIASWNDAFGPLIYVTTEALKTMPVAIMLFEGTLARAGVHAAAVFIMSMPTIIMFLIMRARVMETMAHSGLK